MGARRSRLDAVLLLIFASFLPLVTAATVNRTIDDSFGDSQTGQTVVYSPSTGGTWKDENCVGCAIAPDTSQTFDGTYTAATYNPGMGSMGITMQFTGTAIYVFFILANNQGDGITTLTEANFTVDGGSPHFFQHIPDLTTTTIQYNQLVFSQENLPNIGHTLVITTSGVDTDVYVCFDYAIYTHVDVVSAPAPPNSSGTTLSTSSSTTTSATSTSSTSKTSTTSSTGTGNAITTGSASPSSTTTTSGTTSTTPTGGTTDSAGAATTTNPASNTKSHVSTAAAAGGAVAGVAVLAVIIVFLLLFCRRRKQRGLEKSRSPSPMDELGQATAISPFIHSSAQAGYAATSLRSGLGSGYDRLPVGSLSESTMMPSGHTTMPSAYSTPSAARSDNNSAYGGYVEPSSSGSNASPDAMRGPLRVVTSSDHLLGGEDTASLAPAHPSGDVELTRRARQIELDKRLQTVQQEMMDLASDVSNGEKGARHRSVRRLRASMNRSVAGNDGQEEEMSMSDMREHMRRMRAQIAFLQDQQRSAWAQGLSDDPPPGYTPEISS